MTMTAIKLKINAQLPTNFATASEAFLSEGHLFLAVGIFGHFGHDKSVYKFLVGEFPVGYVEELLDYLIALFGFFINHASPVGFRSIENPPSFKNLMLLEKKLFVRHKADKRP